MLQLMRSATLALCLLVSIRAESDSLRGIHCENVNEFLTRSIFEEPCVSVKRKKKRRKNIHQMSDWLSNNITGLISVNQLHQGSKFKLTAHFLLLQDTHTHTSRSTQILHFAVFCFAPSLIFESALNSFKIISLNKTIKQCGKTV